VLGPQIRNCFGYGEAVARFSACSVAAKALRIDHKTAAKYARLREAEHCA